MSNTPVPANATPLPSSRTPRKPDRRRHINRTTPATSGAMPDPTHRLVVFRADTLEGRDRITAVFPCEPAMGDHMLGFTREEGHMSCSQLWFDMSRPATKEQYAGLASYLRAKGNKLDIRHRLTPAMTTTRSRARELEAAQGQQEDHPAKPPRRPRITGTLKTSKGFKLLGTFEHPAIAADVGSPPSRVLNVVYRAHPERPHEAAAVFPFILPDEPGRLGYTLGGVVVLVKSLARMTP